MDIGMFFSVVLPLCLLAVAFSRSRIMNSAYKRRGEELASFAQANGFTHTANEEFAHSEDWLNFYLFLAANSGKHRFLSLLRGRVSGRQWIFFDFALRLQSLRVWMNPRPFRNFSGAAVELTGKQMPGFVIFRRTPWLSANANPPEEAHLPRLDFPAKNDIRFGDRDFESKYNVQGRDAAAISALLSPAFRRALQDDPRVWFIEGGGDWLVVYYSVIDMPYPPQKDIEDISRVVESFSRGKDRGRI